MLIATCDLDHFVARSDELGGPTTAACADYWQGFEYRPATLVDETLDPFSEAYVNHQLAVYREMSGREFDQLANEHTALNISAHAAAANPYAHTAPGAIAVHFERVSRALNHAAPPLGGRLLDMGCGWGLSTEIAAYSGLKVVAVDVNPDFVELVNRRAGRLGIDAVAVQSTFDEFESDQVFDMILFYECFHHALRPWKVLERMRKLLDRNGRLALAGEPINSHWWKHWGIRLDAMSVYCIRKFGWFESGWSAEFLHRAFERAGYNVQILGRAEDEIGFTVIGSPNGVQCYSARQIGQLWRNDGWIIDGDHMICLEQSSLSVLFPDGAQIARFRFSNFRACAVKLEIFSGDGMIIARELAPGESEVALDRSVANGVLIFKGEIWCPDAELQNGDGRDISVHLEDVTFL